MRGLFFAKRTVKEILRDPLSYIFCLGFPIVMLIIMTIVNKSIPPQAGMDIFNIEKLAPGIAFFGLSFVMIFACIQVATDRSNSLIMRLHASPMKSVDYIVGYTLPMVVIAIMQVVITYAASYIISLITGDELAIGRLLTSIPALLPGAMVFISFGLLFGTVFSEKAAPGICSIIITISGMLGGVWMPVDTMGGTILNIAKALPFYFGVNAAKSIVGCTGNAFKCIMITVIWAVVLYVLAVAVMNVKLKKDIK